MRSRPFHPPANRESYKDLLIFEERLKQNAQRLQKQRRKYEAFLLTLVGVIAYLAYLVFIVPSIYSLVHYGNVAMLLVAVTTLVLFFATGMYSEKIAYAHQFVPQANRALRPFNIYLNTRHRSRFSFLLAPFASFSAAPTLPPSPSVGSALSRTSSDRSLASVSTSDLSSSPSLSRRASNASSSSSGGAASFRSGGAFRSPSISPPASPPLGQSRALPSLPVQTPASNDPVTRAPLPSPSSSPPPTRGVPIPPIPPAQNLRGEVIFSSRVSPQFREGYERYRAEWEKRREEARRAQSGAIGRPWLKPWTWARRGGATNGSGGKGISSRTAEGGAPVREGGEKRQSTRSRESSAVPSEVSTDNGVDGAFPPSRSPSPGVPPEPALSSLAFPTFSSATQAVPSTISTPSSSLPPSRSASPRSLSPPPPSSRFSSTSSSSRRIRAESFSELLTMENETGAEDDGGQGVGGTAEPMKQRAPGMVRSGSRRGGLAGAGGEAF